MGCRDRIAKHVFDDPPRVLPPEPEKTKVALEMDDKKNHKVGALLPTLNPEYCLATVLKLLHYACCLVRLDSVYDSCCAQSPMVEKAV